MPRTTVDTVYRIILQRIKEHRAKGYTTLPPVRTLARESGCALATAVSAIRRLSAQGHVTAVRHVGIRILSEPDTPVAGNCRLPHSLPQRILDDILGGQLDTTGGRLPPVKQLMEHYGAGRVRVNAALRLLESQRWVTRDRRSIKRYGQTAAPSTLCLHILMVGDNRGEIGTFAAHRIPLVRSLEDQCRRSGLQLQLHLVARGFGAPAIDTRMAHTLAAAARDHSTAGFVVCTMHMKAALLEQVRDLCVSSAPGGIILDDGGEIGQTSIARFGAHWQHFSMTHSGLCGYCAGQFLLRHGHTRVAFVIDQPIQQRSWTARRLAGLREAYASAGLYDGVTLFAPDRETAQAVVNVPDFRTGLPDIFPTHTKASYLPKAGSEELQLFSEDIENIFNAQRVRYTRRLALRPLLNTLLADSSITAIVTANDAPAAVCLDILQELRVPVPQRISLLSFDNSEIALERHITSYDFNTSGVAARIVNNTLEPGRFRQQDAAPFELEGFVVERETTHAASP